MTAIAIHDILLLLWSLTYHSNIVCLFKRIFILNSCRHRTTGFSCFHAGSSACEWLALTHFSHQVMQIAFNVQHHTVPLWLLYSGRSPCCTPIPGHTGRARSGCPAAGRQRRSRRNPRRRSSSGWASRGRRTDSRVLGSSCPGSRRAAWLRWRYSPSCGRRGGRLVNKSICTKSSGICRSPRWQIGPGRNSFREIKVNVEIGMCFFFLLQVIGREMEAGGWVVNVQRADSKKNKKTGGDELCCSGGEVNQIGDTVRVQLQSASPLLSLALLK